MTKTAFNRKKNLFTYKLDLYLRKKQVKEDLSTADSERKLMLIYHRKCENVLIETAYIIEKQLEENIIISKWYTNFLSFLSCDKVL